MSPALRILCVGPSPEGLAGTAYAPFDVRICHSLDDAAQALRSQGHDALLLRTDGVTALRALALWPALSHAVLDAAVVVLASPLDVPVAVRLAQLGVQDILPADGADAMTVARSLRLSIERKQLDRSARKAYATDLATGLPNHAQLLEHMTHLLALREREPAPMALLVLRIEGLATTEAALGIEAANVLRRKVAVRLRAGLRASDVVASIGTDAFAVLLAWIDTPTDGPRVAAKLALSLQQTFNVAGQDRVVAVSLGISQYPEQGRQADELLRHALGQAAAAAPMGRAGFANSIERGAAPAANDEG